MPVPLISVDAITVRLRDRWLLAGSSWRIDLGEQWVVTGPNGAGKTTLAKAVAGLLPVVRGAIRYHGFGVLTPTQAIAYVSSDERREIWRQERRLDQSRGFAGRFNDATTVRQWLAGHPFHQPHTEDPVPPAMEIGNRLRLGPLMDKPLMAISTGEMSRVLLARELIQQPKLLILDEPFEGLDGSGRRELQAVLDELAVCGLTMILIVHQAEEMLSTTSHLLTLADGRIECAGPIHKRPAAPPLVLTGATMPESHPALPLRTQSTVKLSAHAPANGSDVLIEMHRVTVRYGDSLVLDRLSWAVRTGEHWAVTGPNGAGKSTLLKLITGDCLQVHANHIRLFGKSRGTEQSLGTVRRRLGVVSHDLASGYQKRISAMDVVCSGFFDSVGLYRHCGPDQRRIAGEWLERLGLGACSGTFFDQLSQGQRQMVLIARAMVKSPQVLILDEPCSGLDAANRRRVLNLVESIGLSEHTSLLFVTHHAQEMPGCMTHRLMLDRGRVVGCGPVDDEKKLKQGEGRKLKGRQAKHAFNHPGEAVCHHSYIHSSS
ncbi:MAG: hypothetical protein CR984_05190, partial [Proteobacteria bacterium]